MTRKPQYTVEKVPSKTYKWLVLDRNGVVVGKAQLLSGANRLATFLNLYPLRRRRR